MKLNDEGKNFFLDHIRLIVFNQYARILTLMCKKLISLDSAFDLNEIVLKTPGFVGADLSALIDEALIAALNR